MSPKFNSTSGYFSFAFRGQKTKKLAKGSNFADMVDFAFDYYLIPEEDRRCQCCRCCDVREYKSYSQGRIAQK